MSAFERSGWRDQTISIRHRDWGYNCPFVDFDGIEYDCGYPVALFEYKNESAAPANRNHPNIRALLDLADRGDRGQLPVFGCRYASNLAWFRVAPLNSKARDLVAKPVQMTEKEFVGLLYRIRGREREVDTVLKFSEEGILLETYDVIRSLWRRVLPPDEMPDNSEILVPLYDEIAALEAKVTALEAAQGTGYAHAVACQSCGGTINGPTDGFIGETYHWGGCVYVAGGKAVLGERALTRDG